MTEGFDDKTALTTVSTKEVSTTGKDACLVVIYGMELGKKHDLNGREFVIGRQADVGLQIDHESVSRRHCVLKIIGQHLEVEDLDSTNGTFVNGDLIKNCVLRDGDLLKVGRCIFKFLSSDNIENSYHEEIYRLTTIDGLTQVFNKRYFLEALEREIGRAQRYQRALSLILFDIDHFKRVNDTYGHLAGDAILKDLASVVDKSTRKEDMLARYGGEEFAIILPEINLEHGILFGKKICKLVRNNQFSFENIQIPITISIGIATIPSDLELRDSTRLIQIADQKLYQAKRQGRDRVVG